MDELLKAADEVSAEWKFFLSELPLQLYLDGLREAIAALHDEVEIQRERIKAGEIAERVEQP